MNKNLARGLVVLGIIILAVLLWWIYHPVAPKVSQGPAVTTKPGTAPTAATPAPSQVKPEAGPGVAPLPGPTAQKPALPPLQEPSTQEPKVTIPQPPAQGKKYGVLVGTYRKYPPAARMLKRLKRMGEPGFVQRNPEDTSQFQVWMGPFSSQDEAQAAAKRLRHRLRRRGKIEEIENPVPK